MSRRRFTPGLLLPSAALALLTTWCAGAAAQGGDFSEVQLESRAIEELRKDALLRDLNLIVMVKGDVATLRGLVPSKELRQRAVRCVRQVPEIREVLDQCNVGLQLNPSLAIIEPKRVVVAPEPRPDQLAKRDPEPNTWVPWTPETIKPEPVKLKEKPPPAAITVTVLPIIQIEAPTAAPKVTHPVSWPKLPATPAVESSELEQSVQRLMQQDVRYRRLQLDVRDGVVSISGVAARWEDVHTLSRTLTHMPGVERVVWRTIRTGG